MIVTEDLTKEFDNFLAVEGLFLTVRPGQVLALLGPNGAGKTTTVRMLASVLAPTRGRARVAGYDVVREASQVRASVGVLTEHHGFYRRMTALEYLDFFGQLYGLNPGECRKRARRLLEDFGLSEFESQRVAHFSRGMQQKLGLARTLLHQPLVLLLDEPTSSLDPESAHIVRDAIQELRTSDRSIILCTHNLAEAEKLADQIAIIHRGRVITQGSAGFLKTKWLGPPIYEVQLAGLNAHQQISLPSLFEITDRGPNWLRFRPGDYARDNPLVLQSLLEQGLPITSVAEVPRSLEGVYMEVMNSLPDMEGSEIG
jgi:ABC-2 type transport system ATP-binding protein